MSDKTSDKEYELFILIADYLSNHDFITNRDVVKLLGKSEATVRRYLGKFVELEMLEAKGEKRSRKYYLTDNDKVGD